MTAHALLSASSSSRWLACTKSARLEQNFEQETSDFALEGTLAHELAELILKKELGFINKRKYSNEFKKIKLNKFFNEEMIGYVQEYVNVCLEKISESRAITSDPLVKIEEKLDFSNWVKKGFGTGDLVIVEDDLIEVVDLKYGKGVPVSAKDNSQMKLYALGALNTFGFLYGINNVRMTIVQPRLDSISVAEISAEELLKWAEEEVKPKSILAYAGEGEFDAGEHCKFCRAKATCKARAEKNIEIAKFGFKNPELLDEKDISSVLKIADNVIKWAKDVQDYALKEAINGTRFEGFKLVEGRSSRKYVNSEIVASLLIQNGLPEEEIYKPQELKPITEIEKKLGKSKFNKLLKDMVFKPNGKPTLTTESDKRQEYNSAVLDFQ